MMRGATLAVLLGMVSSIPGWAAAAVDARAEREAALKAEQAGDWDSALLHYENVYDSTPTTAKEQRELRRKFSDLRPKIKPNKDKNKAGVCTVRVYVFRTVDARAVVDGKEITVKNAYTDGDIKQINGAVAALCDTVWTHTMGNLILVPETIVIDKPFTNVVYWPEEGVCRRYLPAKMSPVDFTMVFANMKGAPFELHRDWTSYSGFDWRGGDPKADLECLLRAWLKGAQAILEEENQFYPVGLMPNTDAKGECLLRPCGGNCGPECFQPASKDKDSSLAWYLHILDTHATRKMWRELSLTKPVDNVWTARFGFCRKFLLLGPFDCAGGKTPPMDTAFIDEANTAPAAGAAAGAKTWREVGSVDFRMWLEPDVNVVCYAATLVQSDKEQEVQVRAGSEEAMVVMQEGKPIIRAGGGRALEADSDIVKVKLRKGDNSFLIKVFNGGGGFGFCFRVTDDGGNPLPDVRYVLPGQKR